MSRSGYCSALWLIALVVLVCIGCRDMPDNISSRHKKTAYVLHDLHALMRIDANGDLVEVAFYSNHEDPTNPPVYDHHLEVIASLSTLRSLDLGPTEITNEGLVGLLSLSKLEVLIPPYQINDEGLKAIGKLSNLRELYLGSHQKITNRGVALLEPLRNLESLSLLGTDVDGGAIEYLCGNKSLKWLNLSSTNLSDDTLDNLACFEQLEYLDLSHTEISDRGLNAIKPMLNHIKTLILWDTKVSKARIKQLQEAGIRISPGVIF